MRLLVVIGTAEFDKEIKSIMENAEVKHFSRTSITGYNDDTSKDMLSNWFAQSNIYDDSIMFFSFTLPEKAEAVLTSVDEYNAKKQSKTRIRAYIMPVVSHN